MELLNVIISFLFFCIRMSPLLIVLFIQVYIIRRLDNKYVFVLPLISFIISIIFVFYNYGRYFGHPIVELNNLISSIILVFILFNIPTILLIIVTIYIKKELINRRELLKIKAQDLQ